VGVEKLDVSVSGTFAGGAGDDDFFVRSNLDGGDSTITGAGGNDKLKGHDHVETIDGGPGDDRVEGGYNHDVLTGGPGRDTIFGDSTTDTCNFLSCKMPFGNDVIYARDGEVDTIDCGPGEDRADVDPIDVVANCEEVGKLGAPPGAAACTVKLTLTAERKTAKTLGARLISSGTGSIAQAGTVKFRAKLTKKARKRIGRLRKGGGTVAALVTEGGATKRYTQAVKFER
jgi:Ca2+-binding RTX toxin-like protein